MVSIERTIRNKIQKVLTEGEREKSRKEVENPPRVDRMSSSGRCPRDRWAKRHGVPVDNGREFSARILSVFRLGHVIEDEVVSLLELAGYKVTDAQREVGEGEWIGHIDGIIEWSPFEGLAGTHRSLLEVKSCNAKRFAELIETGYEKWSPNYASQIQAYMGFLDEIDDAIVFVYNKDASEFHVERIAFDAAHFDRLRRDSLLVTASETVPDRPERATSQSCKFCRWCDRAKWCWDPSTGVFFDEIESRMYRPSEISKLLGVPQQSVYKCIKSGQIKALKLGGRFFIPPREVKRLGAGERKPEWED